MAQRPDDDARVLSPNAASLRVDELDLTVRAHNCLRRAEITLVAELVLKSREELLRLRNMGTTTVRHIERSLMALGLRLGMRSIDITLARRTSEPVESHDLDTFVDAMALLKAHGINRAAMITFMTAEELLAVPGLGPATVEVIECGLRRWGLHFDERVSREHGSDRFGERDGSEQWTDRLEGWRRFTNESDIRERRSGEIDRHSALVSLEDATTFREELQHAVERLLANRRASSCFGAYHGIGGGLGLTLREIAEAATDYGFERPVTRERVRQVLQRTERELRARARRARFARWKPAVEHASRDLPAALHSFVALFGYESEVAPQQTYRMIELCAGIFDLEFPFALQTLDGGRKTRYPTRRSGVGSASRVFERSPVDPMANWPRSRVESTVSENC